MDKVTLDFENNTVKWEMDNLKSSESCPDLHERKDDILAAMGYGVIDVSNAIEAINLYINNKISDDDLNAILNRESE